jgi:phosphohistidine phosphatase
MITDGRTPRAKRKRVPQQSEHDKRHLVLLRHAKSSWADSEIDDHQRPLNARGRHAARLLAGHFAAQTPPDLILCSSALRTRQTLEPIVAALPHPPRISVEDGLYLASAAALRKRIAAIGDDVGRVLVIGHNPGVHELAIALAAHSPRTLRARVSAKFPTAAVASYRFDGSWAGIGHAAVALTDFVTPADLSPEAQDDD